MFDCINRHTAKRHRGCQPFPFVSRNLSPVEVSVQNRMKLTVNGQLVARKRQNSVYKARGQFACVFLN